MNLYYFLFRKNYHYTISIIVHCVILLIIALMMQKTNSGGRVQFGGGENIAVEGMPVGTAQQNPVLPADRKNEESLSNETNTVPIDGTIGTQGQQGNSSGSLFGSADTTGLTGFYSEKTRGVSIYYPTGWKFVDQNVKNKFDGITFLGQPGLNGQAPYVFVQVQDKYNFNPARFLHKMDTDKYEAYYNDPEILEGQYTQIVYIRTAEDIDYMLKFIINGEVSFKEYLPVFLGMVKTFQFGN